MEKDADMERALLRTFQNHIDQATGIWQQFLRVSDAARQAYTDDDIQALTDALLDLRLAGSLIRAEQEKS